jgi:tetratricopeptide (TPR) repeat protein
MTLVKRAADIDPVDFGVRLFEGGLHLAAGAYEMAIHCFRLAAAERPTSSVVAQNLAVAYLRLGATEKSFLELKKAVSLNPINEAALFLLADLAHSKKRDADVIPHLRYYLQFEQGSGPGWARLARACIEVKDLESALTALRQQASISDTSRVWNNIGVVRSLQNDGKRAAEAFKYAMGRASSSDDRDARLAARNFAQLLMSVGLFDELERYVGRLISADTSGVYRRDEVLSDVYVFYFFALRMRRKSREIEELAESVLAQRDSAPQLAAWVLGSMVGYYALYDRGSDKAVSLIAKRISTIEPQLKVTGSLRTMLFNNVAFAYAEAGRISEAEYYLVKIQGALHREPYPTATLGLIDFKKGNVDRGLRRYREAVSLARTQLDKARIRQKLELEFGRFLISVSESRARRHLQRAATFRGGDEATAEQANHELKTLAGSK